MMGWVFFRADTLAAADVYFRALFGIGVHAAPHPLARYLSNSLLWGLCLGIPFCLPLWDGIKTLGARFAREMAPPCTRTALQITGSLLEATLALALLVISSAWLAGGTYNPFIYYRF
jgi:alginate O-acetyltransferase complex protein AlgI